MRSIYIYIYIYDVSSLRVNIHLHALIAFVTVIRVFYKNTDKIKQLLKLHKYNHLVLQLTIQVV